MRLGEVQLSAAPLVDTRVALLLRAPDGALRIALVDTATGIEFGGFDLRERTLAAVERAVEAVKLVREKLSQTTAKERPLVSVQGRMTMNDQIDRLNRAKEALEAARRACEAAGLDRDAGTLAEMASRAAAEAASEEKAMVPIAIGDEVLVSNVNSTSLVSMKIDRVGRDNVYLVGYLWAKPHPFRLEDGWANDAYSHHRIVSDDLRRIKKHLLKPAKASRR